MAKPTKPTQKPKAKPAPLTTRGLRAVPVAEGPRYKVIADSFLDNVFYRAGTPRAASVLYLGEPGTALQPLNAEAKARKQAIRDIRTDPKLTAEQKQAARKELSDAWNGVEEVDPHAESEAEAEEEAEEVLEEEQTEGSGPPKLD